MKSIRIAGACLVAMLALSMALGASASAAILGWEQCGTEKASGNGSKYAEDQCATASGTGAWVWQEVKGTEKVIGLGSLVLRDTKVPIVGTVEVQCSVKAEGTVGPGRFARVTGITEIKCSAGKDCEKVEKVEPRDLPWQMELFETEGVAKDNKITSGGSGAPGWGVTCKVLGAKTEDACTSESTSVLVGEMLTNELTASRWLVGLTFEKNSWKATCSLGGAESGEELGIVGLEKASGAGLRDSHKSRGL
jgi:hypothetical protein